MRSNMNGSRLTYWLYYCGKKFKSSRWFSRKYIKNQFILITWYVALGTFSSVLVPDENIIASKKSTCVKITEPTRPKSAAKVFFNHVAAEWNFSGKNFYDKGTLLVVKRNSHLLFTVGAHEIAPKLVWRKNAGCFLRKLNLAFWGDFFGES